jgi:hypothetical protein
MNRLQAILCQLDAIVDYAISESYSRHALHELYSALLRAADRIDAQLGDGMPPPKSRGAA